LKKTSIAIIGAGWTGLQMGKVLVDCGYEVKIFEALDDVGGTWNPKIAYHGLTIHTPIFLCQFVDYPFSEVFHNNLKRLSFLDIFEYCRGYARDKGLYDLISFNCKMTRLDYNSTLDVCTISITNKLNNESKDYKFDYVISTQFNVPKIPTFPGQDKYLGKIYHSNDIKEDIFNDIIKNKQKVVLVGGSKSGTDFAYMFANRNYNINWIMEQMYWFYSYDNIIYNFKTGKKSGFINATFWFIGFILLNIKYLGKMGYYAWALLGIIKCPGKKHFDFNKFHIGYMDQHQIDIISNTKQIYSSISHLDNKQVVLENGLEIDCDVIICATGCDPFDEDLIFSRDGQVINIRDQKQVYQYSVIPQIPKLCFTAFIFPAAGPENAYAKSAWFLNYVEKNLTSTQLHELCNKNDNWNFMKGSPLFQSNEPYYPLTAERTGEFLSGIADKKGLLGYVYNIHFKKQSGPMKAVRKFIEDRMVRRERKHISSQT